MLYTHLTSPLGTLLLAADDSGLRLISFPNGSEPATPDPAWNKDERPLRELIRQLRAYFAGELETFDLLLAPQGTPFQQKVWTELVTIPYGETISYGQLAQRIGNPQCLARRRPRQRLESHSHRDSLPSRDRRKRQAHRIRRRPPHKRKTSRPRTPPASAVVIGSKTPLRLP